MHPSRDALRTTARIGLLLGPLSGAALAALVSLAGCRDAGSRSGASTSPREGAEVAYVSNEDDGTVTVLDVETCEVLRTIPVGKRPRGLRASQDGARLFVALSGSPKAPPGVDPATLPAADRAADGIGVVDTRRGELTATLPGGRDPETFDLSRDGRLLYVSNEETAETSVVDASSGKVVAVVPVGEEPEGVSTRPDGAVVYVASESDDSVSVIDVKENEVVARIATGARPRAIAFTPDGKRALVTAENAASVTVVDATKHEVVGEVAIEGGKGKPRPMGVVVSKDGRKAYVSNGRAGSVSEIDVAASKVSRTFEHVGARPWGLDLSGDGRRLVVANGPSNDVAIIDLESGGMRRCKAGASPWGVAFSRSP